MPLLESFAARYPQVRVDYQDLHSLTVHQRFLMQSAQSGVGEADLLISSAIDLQFKLANDGHALAYASPAAEELPTWAVWRNEIFGFTFEPVVMVYNRAALSTRDIPRNHAELGNLLRRQPRRFRARIATYNPSTSGVGYLFATQDAELFPEFWDLVAALGATEVQLHDTTAAILDRVASGEYLLGYNLLGSYARSRADQDPRIGPGLLVYRDRLKRVGFLGRWMRTLDSGRWPVGAMPLPGEGSMAASLQGLNPSHH